MAHKKGVGSSRNGRDSNGSISDGHSGTAVSPSSQFWTMAGGNPQPSCVQWCGGRPVFCSAAATNALSITPGTAPSVDYKVTDLLFRNKPVLLLPARRRM